MKQSTKVLLLSSLVFPGSGHIYLKKYFTGLTLIIISVTGLYYIIDKAVELTTQIVDDILSHNVPPDFMTINDMVTRQWYAADNFWLNIATAAITLAWVYGIIDSYRLGVKLDRDTQS